jgi:hypothetical protein
MVCVLAVCESVSAQANPLVAIEATEGEGGNLSWRATFGQDVELGHAAPVLKFLKSVAGEGRVLTGKDAIEIAGKKLTIKLGAEEGGRRSALLLKGARVIYKTKDKVHYAVYARPLFDKETRESLAKTVAAMDGTLRGHKVGENDGITVRYQVKEATNGIVVELTYSGGMYGPQK